MNTDTNLGTSENQHNSESQEIRLDKIPSAPNFNENTRGWVAKVLAIAESFTTECLERDLPKMQIGEEFTIAGVGGTPMHTFRKDGNDSYAHIGTQKRKDEKMIPNEEISYHTSKEVLDFRETL